MTYKQKVLLTLTASAIALLVVWAGVSASSTPNDRKAAWKRDCVTKREQQHQLSSDEINRRCEIAANVLH